VGATLPSSWSASFQPNWRDLYEMLEATRALSNVEAFFSAAGVTLTAGTGTANTLAGPTVPFQKLRGATDSYILCILMLTSFFSAGTSPVVIWGIGAGTAMGTNLDTDVTSWAGTTGHHDPQMGVQKLTPLDAGYYNLNLYYRVTGASAAININSGDSVAMVFQEVPL